eukprot:1149523-Pelagomonas_calceolata.AAC.3
MKLVESSNMNLRLGGADILLRNSTGSRAMQARKQQQMRAAASLRSLGLTHPTPMIELVWGAHSNSLRLKMECLNLTGSLHDRTALSCIAEAEKAGAIQPGASRLIEASFGSSGIAMAMAASMQGWVCRPCMIFTIHPSHFMFCLNSERSKALNVQSGQTGVRTHAVVSGVTFTSFTLL